MRNYSFLQEMIPFEELIRLTTQRRHNTKLPEGQRRQIMANKVSEQLGPIQGPLDLHQCKY